VSETAQVAAVRDSLRRVWGYSAFLPLQEEAVRAVLEGRDSLVVLPTGGGKSICYQAPAAHLGCLAIVVSPLIALMKDQVDALRQNGVRAAYLNSSQSRAERAATERELGAGRLTLLYVAPERLTMAGFAERLRRARPAFFAIDEAHCISQWGHDFRPEYRQLRVLKQAFPGTAVHAYTATATPPVQADIISELRLARPVTLVGPVDRPNLIYRVKPRADRVREVLAAIDRHRGQAGIVYCIRRADVDELGAALVRRGLRAAPYHAGLPDDVRRANQDAFVRERVDIVVATVAFGMGIDRSNVRYVVHTGMPKSLEHYQQEAGRAGRDGLEAECVLLWSGADYAAWKSLLESEAVTASGALRKLGEIFAFCRDAVCRHAALAKYFGQEYAAPSCGRCDVCLGEVASVDGAQEIVTTILRAVAELRGRFGAAYVTDVLTGASTDRIHALEHDRCDAYRALGDVTKREARGWVEQLLGQGLLARSEGEYPTVALTRRGAQVLRGETPAGPLSRAARAARPSAREDPSRRGAPESRGALPPADILFEVLRRIRRELADERGVPPYVIFSDATLRELARLRPATPAALLAVKGVGAWKCEQFGARFIAAILSSNDESPPEASR
jgi:ATP-dependent DNA helicase RecQ